MKKYLVILFICFCNSMIVAQSYELYKGDTINRTNGKKERVGLWYFFHSNGELKSKMSYKDGKPFGFMIIHDSLGNVSESGFWDNGRWQGNYESYYPNGNKKLQVTFDTKGRQIGYSVSYYQNGIVEKFHFYIDSLSTVSAKYDSTGNRSELKANFDLIKDSDENVISTIEDFVSKENTVSRQNEELRRNRIIFILGGILLLVFVFFLITLFRNNRFRKKTNLILAEQKDLLGERNKEITDSINYAQRIQRSILPPLNEVSSALPNSFILFKPKDIVSGDFYWFYNSLESGVGRTEKNNKVQSVLIAAADCTGHGVPGAFMSTIGSEKLNEAVTESTDVSEILNLVNRGMKKVLRQSEKADSTRDGMDIALCAFNKEMTKVEYSGANRPLWIVRPVGSHVELVETPAQALRQALGDSAHILSETKATKVAIGGYTEDEQVFTKHTIDLQKGDSVYIFSDGYADQFSPQDKKLMTRKFKEILLSIQNKSMEEQKKFLGTFIEDWRGDMEQTDDILVIGVRI